MSAKRAVKHVADNLVVVDTPAEIFVESGWFVPEDGNAVNGKVFRCQRCDDFICDDEDAFLQQ
jgi:hypothetical protein